MAFSSFEINEEVKTLRNDGTIEFEKYLSLINTLKGHEEYLLDKDGLIISSNLETANVTGYEEFEVMGKHFSLFYTLKEKSNAFRDLKHASERNQIVVSGIRLKKRGSTFWAKMRIRHLTDKYSKTVFKVTLQDATHRAISNIRVQTIRDEYLSIFNNPFVGVFKFRMSDLTILMCNEMTMTITQRKDLDGTCFNNLFRSPEQFSQFIRLLYAESKIDGFKFLINDNKVGSENWGVISAKFFRNQGFVEGVIMDISEQYHQMMELERVNSELDNFVYHASHDLRAPFMTIIGLLNLCEVEQSIENVRPYLEMIRGRVLHLDTLLKDLTSISVNSKTEIASENFSFDNEVGAIIKEYEVYGYPITVHFTINQACEFTTDRNRVTTILRNLISNAFEYHNPNISDSFIRITIDVKADHAAIQLQDNGIGIELSCKDRIYDMFFRGTTLSTGTGLGLYIVKCMIEKIQGKISFESTIDEGTTFLLTIPNGRRVNTNMNIMESNSAIGF